MIMHLDLETFSAAELKDVGQDNYSNHPSTGVHCAAYAFGDEPVCLWTPGERVPERVADHILSGGVVVAHNAPFEIALTNNVLARKHGWPELKPEQMRCTLAMAYAMALPGALENAAPACGIAQRKDQVGKRIMLKWCRPKLDGTFWRPEDDPEQFQALVDYCRQDVEVERALHHRLMDLSDDEQRLWALDYKINQRGVLVDLPSIGAAIGLVEREKGRLNAEMLKVTGGVVGSCTEVQLLVKWIRSQGVEIPGLAKADVLDALSGNLPPQVRAALRLRKEAAKSSTAKLTAMRDRASADGRVRNIHQYHGANTGRWAGRGIQVQNLPRPRVGISAKDVPVIIDMFKKPELLDMSYGPIMDALADCVRGMIIAKPGHDLIAVDFSAVEARVLAWLAGEKHVLDTFRRGEDLYKAAAARIYGVPVTKVTKDQRQIGKVATLALGYGGGVGAFQAMARGYGVVVPDAEAEAIKTAWRQGHPNIVRYWYELEQRAIEASYGCDSPVWRKRGSFLWCRLPSGRVLCYPYPEIRTVSTPWGSDKDALTYMTVVDDNTRRKGKILQDTAANGNWQRISTYGGSLAENVTQAVARDLLRDAMFRLEAAGYPVIMHVHDEAVVEVPTSCDDRTLSQIEELMAETPAWAKGLPLAAEGWRGTRYRK